VKLERHKKITHLRALDLLTRVEHEFGKLTRTGDVPPAAWRDTRDALASHVRSGLVRRPKRRTPGVRA
jgi:hypothetical protein